MALNVGQRQQNVHLCNPKKECKDVIATLWDIPCLFNDDEWLLSIFVIFNRMLVGVLVQKYIWILEPHHHSSWRAVLYHWKFYPMFHMMSSTSWCNLDPSFHEYKMLVVKYSRNGIIISYLFPSLVLCLERIENMDCGYGNTIMPPIHIIKRFPLFCTCWNVFWCRRIVIIIRHKIHYQHNLILIQDC